MVALEQHRTFYEAGRARGRELCGGVTRYPEGGRPNLDLELSVIQLKGGLEAARAFLIGLARTLRRRRPSLLG